MSEDIRPLLFSLADALEIDIVRDGDQGFSGSRKAVLELFEGYSPTIISGIEHSLLDRHSKIVAADVHIFGNLGAVIVIEGQQSHVSLFVYDRSKRPERPPWSHQIAWSRKELYSWLEGHCKAIYHRSVFETEWKRLPSAHARLKTYNCDRADNYGAKPAYMKFWGGEI